MIYWIEEWDTTVAFIYGPVARGKEYRDSDVDVLVVGDATLRGKLSTPLYTRGATTQASTELSPTQGR